MRMISLGELIRVQESIMLPVIFPLENPPTRFSELFSDDVGDPVWNFDRWEVQWPVAPKILTSKILLTPGLTDKNSTDFHKQLAKTTDSTCRCRSDTENENY